MARRDVFREDGRPRNGGLLGPVVDYYAVRANTILCPFCQKRINKEAVKCGFCNEWLVPPEQAIAIAQENKAREAQKATRGRWLWGGLIVAVILMALFNRPSGTGSNLSNTATNAAAERLTPDQPQQPSATEKTQDAAQQKADAAQNAADKELDERGGAITTAQFLVRQKLKDPDSAQFSDDYTYRHDKSDGTVSAVCGYVNAKNSFGAYTGYTPFVTLGVTAIISRKFTQKTLSHWCPDK